MQWMRASATRRCARYASVALAVVTAGAALVVVPGTSRAPQAAAVQSSSFNLVLSTAASGTAPFDAPASCTPALQVGAGDVIPTSANSTGQSHCPGMDHSAADGIVRTLDTVTVKFDWQLVSVAGAFTIGGQPADSNLTVVATLPLAANGQPLATWTAIPGACYLTSSGVNPTIVPLSALSNANRTLTCNLGHKIQSSTSFFNATYRTTGWATDGTKISLSATILADSTRTAGNPATSSNTQSVWASGTSKYNLRLDQNGNFGVNAGDVLGPGGEDGRLVTMNPQVLQPLGTETVGNSAVGPPATGSPFQFDVDLSRFGAVAAADGIGTIASRARLYTWGANPTGCLNASQVCSQPGGPGTPIHVKLYGMNTGTVNPNNFAWVYVYVWIPNSALPAAATTLTAGLTGFDPTTLAGPNFPNGQSNYGGNPAAPDACAMVPNGSPNPTSCEPGLIQVAAPPAGHTANNDNEYYTSITHWNPPGNVRSSTWQSFYYADGDIRTGGYNGFNYSYDNTYYGALPIAANGTYSDTNASVLPGTQILATSGLRNTGTGMSTSNGAICEKWDPRTQKLTDFGDPLAPIAGGAKYSNAPYVPNTWSLVLTSNSYGAAPVWNPGAKWYVTAPFTALHPRNLEADPAHYTVQFGVHDFAPWNATMTNMKNTSCRNQDSVVGWFSSPNDPAIQAWIDATYGVGSGITPLDVVDMARVTLADDMQPAQAVDLVVRLTARTAWGPITAGGLAGQTIPGGTRLAFMGAFTDSYITGLGNNGTTRQNGWQVGAYDPSADTGGGANGGSGDRLTVASVDVKANTSTLWPSPTAANGVASIIAGQDLWIKIDPFVFSPDGVPAGTPSYPVRVITWLPPSLSYVPGSGCRVTVAFQYATACTATAGNQGAIEPVLVANADGNGGTAAIWDLGRYVPNAGAAHTSVVFRTTSDVLTNNGVAARVADVIESKNGDGTSNFQHPVCSSLAPAQNLPIPATTYGPAETLSVPTACTGYRESAQTVTVWNASGLVFSGKAAQQQVEVNDADDGTGNLVAYTVTTKNFDSNAVPWTDQIIALPWNGDGRRPASAYHGSITMQSVATSDALSVAPNAIPADWTNMPARNGTTFYFTSRPVSQVSEDPSDGSNLLGGLTQWCLANQLGVVGGCPASVASASAVRVISGNLAANGASRTVTLKYATSGNQRLDVYAFHSIARAANYALQVRSVDTSMTVVDSAVGGTLWLDRNGNGFMDGNEPVRLTGVRVQLVDANQVVVSSTTTDGSGSFNFPGLHSGTYTVKVVNTNGVDGASDVYPALANSCDIDSGSINSGGHPDLQATLAVAKNVQRSDVVFGFATTSLSGFAWRDDNRDGLVDPGEPPVKNETITLTGTNDLGGAVSLQTTTDNLGQYLFANLRPGTYTVATTAQVGAVVAYAGTAGGTATNTEVDGIVLAGGMTADNYMFATVAPSAKILVFDDHDGNGLQGANEHGVGGVRAHIRSRALVGGLITQDSTTTDVTGNLSLYS